MLCDYFDQVPPLRVRDPLAELLAAPIHKIGVTGGKDATRLADAENQANYLLAPVRLRNLNQTKMENIIFHRLFRAVQLDLTIGIVSSRRANSQNIAARLGAARRRSTPREAVGR